MAYNSRLLFRSKWEFREALGVSVERGMQKSTVNSVFGKLSRKADRVALVSLDEAVSCYVAASKFYLELDWGDRVHSASRKRFCRLLMRLYVAPGVKVRDTELNKFKLKEADRRLLSTFFPEGFDKPAVDLGYILLLAFGVIKPWMQDSRGRDISNEETAESLRILKSVILLLQEDMPQPGKMSVPKAFEYTLSEIENHLNNPETLYECTPLWMAFRIDHISHSAMISIKNELKRMGEYHMWIPFLSGIWVDNIDEGKTRFWICALNKKMIFCYQFNGLNWELLPFKLQIYSTEYRSLVEPFVMLHPTGILNEMLAFTDDYDCNYVAKGKCALFEDSSHYYRRLEIVRFNDKLPEWLDWKYLYRLKSDDPRYEQLRSVLAGIYEPSDTNSVLFSNPYSEIVNTGNNIVGRDKNFIYVHDYQPESEILHELEEGAFFYGEPPCKKSEEWPPKDLDISKEHPLYALPMNMECSSSDSRELIRLAEILNNADEIEEAYIFHSPYVANPRLIFPAYGASIELDMEALARLGVLRFTSRPW